MQPEQAVATLQALGQALAMEHPTTRKVIAAVPETGLDYKPHEKSMSAMELAWHIASAEIWFLNGIADGAFANGDSSRPAEMNSIAAVLAYYDKEYPVALARVNALSPEALAKPVDFYGVFNMPAVTYLGFMNSHSIHHRGQLSVYLRPMGAKVPSIYGGSADEPFQAASA
jgi:uncharacterized damage-inducible protein DinB